MEINTGKIIDVTLMLGALGYFILPADVIPDVLGPLGYLDDGAALTFAFKKAKSIFSNTSLEAAFKKTESIMGSDFDGEKIAKLIAEKKK